MQNHEQVSSGINNNKYRGRGNSNKPKFNSQNRNNTNINQDIRVRQNHIKSYSLLNGKYVRTNTNKIIITYAVQKVKRYL